MVVLPPAILRGAGVAPPREHELAPPVLGRPPEPGVVLQHGECRPHAREPRGGETRVAPGDEIEQALEVAERPVRQDDARHDRARGRRAPRPATRCSR